MGIVSLFSFIILTNSPAELPFILNGYSFTVYTAVSAIKEGKLSTHNEKRDQFLDSWKSLYSPLWKCYCMLILFCPSIPFQTHKLS